MKEILDKDYIDDSELVINKDNKIEKNMKRLLKSKMIF